MPNTDLRSRETDGNQLGRYRAQYLEKRRRQSLSVIPVCVLGIAAAVTGGNLGGLPEKAVLGVVGLVVLGFFGFSLINWRCPRCGAYLGQRLNPSQCRSCGTVLRD